MPNRCSVPGCRSNYDSQPTATSTFSFPKDEQQRKKWLSLIKRKDFSPGPCASVCIKHFDERFIVRKDQFGSFKKLRLVPGAYPTQFPNSPSYQSKKLPKVRKIPTERRKEIKERPKDILTKLCEKDKIKSLDDMKEILGQKLTDPWQYKVQEDSILIYKIEISYCPKVPVSIQVLSDLTVNAYHNNIHLDTKSVLGFALGPELKLNKWKKLARVLNHLSSIQAKDIPVDHKLNMIRQILNEIIEADGGDKYSDKLKFISEQLMLAFSKQLRYNPDIILWCSKLYFQYPEAYSLLRKTELLTLPSPSRLRYINGYYDQDK